MSKYKGKTVVFCLPGKEYTNNFLMSWSELLVWCMTQEIRPMLVNRYSPNLYYVRNMCLGGDTIRGVKQIPYGGMIKYDYLMWIDSDMVFNSQHFEKLLKADKPIISGLYIMQNNVNYATVEKMDDELYKKTGSYQFLSHEDIQKKKEPFEVDYTGFGWMLIKQGVFEQLDYPWFRPLWSDFSTPTKQIEEFCTEDVAFCKLMKEKGQSVWVHPDVIVGHEKMMIL